MERMIDRMVLLNSTLVYLLSAGGGDRYSFSECACWLFSYTQWQRPRCAPARGRFVCGGRSP